jgi:ketosteroid isomerase-like protein
MSNIEVFERCLEALSEGDVETLVALSADDVEIRPLRAALEDTVYRGHAGIEQWIADITETWAELRIELESVREAAPGSVIGFVTLHGRGRESGAPTSLPLALTGRFREGLVFQAATWTDRAAALRAAEANSID